MKKTINILLILLLSITNVYAANNKTTKGTITINNTIVNETYEIYKILDLETYEGDNYIYRASTWKPFIESETGKQYLQANTNGGDTYYTWVNNASESLFAQETLNYAKTNNIDATQTIKATTTTVTFTNLELGYYLIKSGVGTVLHLTTTNPNGIVNEKNTKEPKLEKLVEENSTGLYQKENDTTIGSNVKYKTTITTGAGYTNYTLYDVMDKGLTFNNDIIVKIGNDLVDNTNYKITTTNKNYTFIITFTDEFIKTRPLNTNIDIYYTALLNEEANLEEEGNINKTYLTYNNNNKIEKTPENKTITYTYIFNLIKTNKEDEILTGAEFKLLDKNKNNIKVVLKEETTNTYRLALPDEEGTLIKAGNAIIEGLDEETYYLEEITAPEGYNKLTNYIKLEIKGKLNNQTYERVQVKVINYTGKQLPETGGKGTTLFITIGSLITLISGLLLVTKLRLYKNI